MHDFSQWLQRVFYNGARLTLDELVVGLLTAFIMGCVVAAVYRLTTRSASLTGFLGTLVMLCVLISLITMVIGDNTARAFSLVGALAIVRFRTVVEDTRDTAFVIYAVASGMACGAGYVVAAMIVTPLVFAAAWVFRPRPVEERRSEQILVLRLATAPAVEEKVQAILVDLVPGCKLKALATARGGTALDVTYAIDRLPAKQALSLVTELNRLEGVQGVELKD